MTTDWEKTYNAGYDSASQTFRTHLNYVKCMDRLTLGLSITVNISATQTLSKQKIAKFEALAHITEISIGGEKTACDNQKEYAQVASPWIPVKCYYYLYYLESVFLYLLNSSEAGFNHNGHSTVKSMLLSMVKSNEITLVGAGASSLSTITTWLQADNFKTSGSTLSPSYHSSGDCENSLRGKVAEYIEIDWKQGAKIKDYRKKTAKNLKVTVLQPKEFCLLDYFYWMRIKSNYRDIDFLDFDNNVNENDAYEYLTYYIKTTFQYAEALKSSIQTLKQNRGMV